MSETPYSSQHRWQLEEGETPGAKKRNRIKKIRRGGRNRWTPQHSTVQQKYNVATWVIVNVLVATLKKQKKTHEINFNNLF